MMKNARRTIVAVLLMAAALIPQICFADALPADPADRFKGAIIWIVLALIAVAVIAVIVIKRRNKK